MTRPDIKSSESTKQSHIAELMFPEATLIVKVEEVANYPGTRDLNVIGKCLIFGDQCPFEGYFLTNNEYQGAASAADFKPGSIYLMTGLLCRERFHKNDGAGLQPYRSKSE